MRLKPKRCRQFLHLFPASPQANLENGIADLLMRLQPLINHIAIFSKNRP